jgi:hypothetical protein
MAMKWRMVFFMFAFFGTGLPVGVFAVDYGPFYISFAWFAVFAVAQFYIFRCPHCGKVAIITPDGIASPFVGTSCRYCGKEY